MFGIDADVTDVARLLPSVRRFTIMRDGLLLLLLPLWLLLLLLGCCGDKSSGPDDDDEFS